MKQYKKSLLVVDTIPASPHTEVLIDFANRAASLGFPVYYLCLFPALPILDWHGPICGEPTRGRDIRDWTLYVIEKLHPSINRLNIENIISMISSRHTYTSVDSHIISHLDKVAKAFLPELIPGDPQFKNFESIRIKDLFLESSLMVYKSTQAALDLTKVNSMLVFNGRTPSTAAQSLAALSRNVEVFYHERGSTPSHYFLSRTMPSKLETYHNIIKNLSNDVPDFVLDVIAGEYFSLVWDRKRPGLELFNFNKSQASFNPFYESQGQCDTFTPTNQCVFIVSSLDELNAIVDYDYSIGWTDQISALSAVVNETRRTGTPLKIRCHPHQRLKQAELDLICRIADASHCEVILPDSEINTIKLSLESRWILTYVSSTAWELGYLNRPVGLMGKSLGHLWPGVPELRGECDLRRFFEDDINFSRDFSIRLGYFMRTFGIEYREFIASSDLNRLAGKHVFKG